MIGLIAEANEHTTAEEFFELFKTAWEYYVPGRQYDIVITSGTNLPDMMPRRLLVVYSSASNGDERTGVTTESRKNGDCVRWRGNEIPIYGHVAVLCPFGRELMWHCGTLEPVAVEMKEAGCAIVRIGYDLFYEVGYLLSKGQPPKYAHLPTLDTHISVLRSVMVDAGVTFIEVLPVQPGYEFMVCLTHDVDFVGIADHKFDRSMLGFLYRASVGSFLSAIRGEKPWSRCLQNWGAVLSLPLVFLRLKEDFWLEFDRYQALERNMGSTFFFIPFDGVAGKTTEGNAPAMRAAKYDVFAIREDVRNMTRQGCEVGVHGIDAWCDARKGRKELERIRTVSGQVCRGTRMHWLYWSEQSPEVLETAGFDYDSTFGYNDAVGFRAGTAQVFRPMAADHLLELPLVIQDSALFYPDRMGLSEAEALSACRKVIQAVAAAGGAITINWHTRSLSPERLWGDFYRTLLGELQQFRIWSGTAQRIVDWFRERRAIRFDFQQKHPKLEILFDHLRTRSGAGFTVRCYRPGLHSGSESAAYSDVVWDGNKPVVISTEVTI
jgi:hypothetical protein